MKYIIRKGTQEYDDIAKTGLASMTEEKRRNSSDYIFFLKMMVISSGGFLPQTSQPSSNLNHPDVAEPIMQVLLLEHVAQALSSLSNSQVTH